MMTKIMSDDMLTQRINSYSLQWTWYHSYVGPIVSELYCGACDVTKLLY